MEATVYFSISNTKQCEVHSAHLILNRIVWRIQSRAATQGLQQTSCVKPLGSYFIYLCFRVLLCRMGIITVGGPLRQSEWLWAECAQVQLSIKLTVTSKCYYRTVEYHQIWEKLLKQSSKSNKWRILFVCNVQRMVQPSRLLFLTGKGLSW